MPAPSNHPTHPSRTSASSTSNTSTTATQTQTNPYTSTPVLRLRATGPAPSARRRIQWAEDVVDNEGLGRKQSKVCCIYHAPRPVGESSDESSSDDDSDSDSDQSESGGGDDGTARMGGKGKGKGKGRRREGEGDEGEHDGCDHDHHGEKSVKRKSRNAYEAVPKKGKAATVEVKS